MDIFLYPVAINTTSSLKILLLGTQHYTLIYKNKESIYQFTVNQLSSNFAILSL